MHLYQHPSIYRRGRRNYLADLQAAIFVDPVIYQSQVVLESIVLKTTYRDASVSYRPSYL